MVNPDVDGYAEAPLSVIALAIIYCVCRQ